MISAHGNRRRSGLQSALLLALSSQFTMNRRAFLQSTLALAAPPQITREIFLRSPGKGTALMASAYYTRKSGGEMLSVEQRWSRSDTIDVAYTRKSKDHGKTWSEPTKVITGEKRTGGMWRKHLRPGWVDPRTGRYIDFWVEGVLPSDDPLEGMRQWNIFYSVNGRPARQIMQKGSEFSKEHPLPGVYHGKNSVMLGDSPCQPVAAPDGSILLPASVAPLGPDGKLANPLGAYTFHDAAILHGKWKGNQLEWESGPRIEADPQRATRGMDEPTLARLANGKWICVMRGSNDKKPTLPSYRWISISNDGGWNWTKPAPWTYHNGEAFFSPSACSQLIAHPNGRLYWAGNIAPENPRGNRPRYPFVIGEVDRDSALLIKSSLRVVDDRQAGEDPILSLSNFYARVDRQSGGIAIHMTRLFAFNDGWVGDAYLYRVPV